MKGGLVSRGRPSAAACRPTSAHLPSAPAALGLMVLVLVLLIAPTAEAVQQGDNYYSRTASILRFLECVPCMYIYILLGRLSVNPTSPLTYVDTYPAHTTTHIHSASALDGPQQQQQQHEESVASQVAACAKSLSLSSTRQLLPSAAFAAKAAATTTRAPWRAGRPSWS